MKVAIWIGVGVFVFALILVGIFYLTGGIGSRGIPGGAEGQVDVVKKRKADEKKERRKVDEKKEKVMVDEKPWEASAEQHIKDSAAKNNWPLWRAQYNLYKSQTEDGKDRNLPLVEPFSGRGCGPLFWWNGYYPINNKDLRGVFKEIRSVLKRDRRVARPTMKHLEQIRQRCIVGGITH